MWYVISFVNYIKYLKQYTANDIILHTAVAVLTQKKVLPLFKYGHEQQTIF